MLFDIKALIRSIMRANTISLWMFPQFSKSVNVLIFAVVKEVFLVSSFQVLFEVRYLDDWLFEELIGLSFLYLPPSHLLSSSQLLSCWLWSFMSFCDWYYFEFWLLLRLFLCWLLIIKNLLLILFVNFSFILWKFCLLWLYFHHVRHTEEYYRCL